MKEKIKRPDSNWYKNIWTLDIKDQSWVANTPHQVDFLIEALDLKGEERILDLACGYGRHSLEFARRGYSVIGIDITKEYIDDANKSAKEENLDASFYLHDLRDLLSPLPEAEDNSFDVVLNLADGAIGYLENDEENLKIFKVISQKLKKGGKSLIDICNQDHAVAFFPKKHWEIGEKEISLPWFDFDKETKRMLYGGFEIKLGEKAEVPETLDAHSCTRLYSYTEVTEIFKPLGLETRDAYGEYELSLPADKKHIQLIIVSEKVD